MSIDVILLEPESPGNIGSVARVMKNFGFENLVLVNPCEINDETRGFAMHGWDLVKYARVLDKIPWKEYDFLVGTSGKTARRNVVRNYTTPEELRSVLNKRDLREAKIGILFGRESRGLTNDELGRCDIVCRIPTHKDYPIMNISHAVAVILYELSRVEEGQEKLSSREQREEMQKVFKGIINILDYPEIKKEKAYNVLKNLIGKSLLTKDEFSSLIGIFRRIKKCLK
ncbi:MAG: RNA methyltransferase [Candidatus Aenigmarchaeota archaeon]|nr:RNA methyltransferase [Candidatus Aenigmarchaeota archaeon]